MVPLFECPVFGSPLYSITIWILGNERLFCISSKKFLFADKQWLITFCFRFYEKNVASWLKLGTGWSRCTRKKIQNSMRSSKKSGTIIKVSVQLVQSGMSPDSHIKKCLEWGWTFENRMFFHSIFGYHPKIRTEFEWRLLYRLSSWTEQAIFLLLIVYPISNTPSPVLFNFFELRMVIYGECHLYLFKFCFQCGSMKSQRTTTQWGMHR